MTESLAERLARLRADRDESLQQVADAVGVSKAHIWELERGSSDNPGIKLVRALAAHFGCSVIYLIGEVGVSGPTIITEYNDTREAEALRLVDTYLSCSLRAQREAVDFAMKAQQEIDRIWGRKR